MPIDPASLDLATLTELTGAAVQRDVLHRLRAAGFDGIRVSHGFVVQRLLDDDPTIGELADDLGVSQQAASKTVAEMERLGLVERRADDRDHRTRRVVLTRRGRSAVDAARAARAGYDDVAGPDDTAVARRVLVALLDRAGGLDAVRGRRVPPVE